MTEDGHLTLSERFARMDRTLESLGASFADLARKSSRDYERLESLDRRVSDLESWLKWCLRLVAGGVIAAGLAALGMLAA